MDEHATAVLARLRAHQYLTVIDGPADGTEAAPYLVTYIYVPDERRTKLIGATDETTITVVTHAVAETGQGARIISRNAREQLLDHVLAVPGWKCKPISHAVGRSPDWTKVGGVTLMDAVDEWDYLAEPL